MVPLRRVASLLLGLALAGSALPVAGAEGPSSDQVADADPQLELPKTPRTVSDVPRFAGPATLKLNGKPGVYRWTDIHFGAQEVAMRVALVPEPGDDSCVASVRLGSGKPPLHRATYRADSAEKAKYRTVVGVDYETVPLTLASDCGAWSLALVPREDPAIPLKISQRHYTVKGRTTAELTRALDRIDGKWAAMAWSWATWRFRWIDRGPECEVISGAVSVKARLKLPKWKRPPDVHSSVVSEWERVRESLLIHELGHVTFALQGAHAIDERLDAGLKARTCKKVDRMANRKARAIWDRHQDRDDRYDRVTDHGRTQGTWFGHPSRGEVTSTTLGE